MVMKEFEAYFSRRLSPLTPPLLLLPPSTLIPLLLLRLENKEESETIFDKRKNLFDLPSLGLEPLEEVNDEFDVERLSYATLTDMSDMFQV